MYALSEKAGVDNPNILEMKASIHTKVGNAYVTGFSDTKRIVVFDNLIDLLNDNELLVIIAHELGHYRLNHKIKFCDNFVPTF